VKKLAKVKSSSNISFPEIFTYLKADLEQIDQIIIDNCHGEAELISEITKYILLSGGKRVRPILTILSSKICNYDSTKNHHYNLAAAVELIHTATLLHDDVVDEGVLRRGKKTANAVWGNKASILVGDYLLSTAFQLMVKSESLSALDLLSNVSKIMSDGEVMQLVNSTDINISREKYLQIISQKTAILFAASTSVGAIISNSSKAEEEALYNFGINLGISFQIMDDVLDYSSSKAVFGKEVGDDFYEGKVTLPIIITYNKANEEERRRIEEIFNQNLINDDKDPNLLAEISALMEKYEAHDLSTLEAQSYYQKALKDLNIFPDCTEKDMLLAIANYAVARKK
jgi:octaprenyl-diphosphate synthase